MNVEETKKRLNDLIEERERAYKRQQDTYNEISMLNNLIFKTQASLKCDAEIHYIACAAYKPRFLRCNLKREVEYKDVRCNKYKGHDGLHTAQYINIDNEGSVKVEWQ